jgi:hypothetical protein
MKSFTKISVFIFLGLSLSFNSFAQKDYSAKLKKNLITITAGKYSTTDYMFLTFSNGKTAQVKVSASCPTDAMSRDVFISTYTTYSLILLLATFNQAGLGMPDIKDLDELIGDPDLTYNFVMAKNGMQIQTITSAETKNTTFTWEQIYK